MTRFRIASLSASLLLGLVSASTLSGGTVYNFEDCSTGSGGSGGPIGVWNNAPPAACDNWYTPPTSLVPGTTAASVYTYGFLNGAAGLNADPAGGSNVLGLKAGSTSTVERAQHDFNFSQAVEWGVSFDLSAFNVNPSGNSYGTAYIGNFSVFNVNASVADFIVLNQWDNSSPNSTWSSAYYVYNADGSVQNNGNGVSPGLAWTGLQQNHFYSESIVFNDSSNEILSLSITDLTTSSTTTVSPAGWYMAGGSSPQSTANAIRFSGLYPSNVLLVDNVTLNDLDATAPEPAAFFLAGAGVIALLALRRRDRLRGAAPRIRMLWIPLCRPVLLFVAARAASAMDGVTQGGGTDTPEPSSLVMAGIGLAAGGYALWRSRRTRVGTQKGKGDANSRVPGSPAGRNSIS